MPVQAQQPPSAPPERSFLDKAAYVAAPGAVVVGLLYYFGNQYNEAYYRAFGVPLSDLPLSIEAVLARSPQTLFFPVWVLLVCGLLVLLVLGWLGHALARPENERWRRTAYRALLAVGLLLGVVGGYPVFFREDLLAFLPAGWPRGLLPSLVVALGATLAFFAIQVRLGQHDAGRRNPRARDADRLWLVAGALLLGMLTLSLFHGVSRYAAMAGEAQAVADANGGMQRNPAVEVLSRLPLVHHAKDIEFMDLGAGAGPYRYRYRGFRLLVKTPTRFYLVPYYGGYKNTVTVVLPDDDGTVRVQMKGSVR
ncbi:hypothetical protein DEJ50_00685 [Streptomyces venezuelae]|uniref:Uncharacterized protein n=1 Tax=Streptomyces venezuelae TaxID=54571 RepID=A0A5P2CVW3_STRVZ|nr:hypothetical protein [Streptomyces venezuelae]QES46583.1 hypothetical protein DEJ50_00685 [Streptomyces venezuelae]